jgi:TolB-like protein
MSHNWLSRAKRLRLHLLAGLCLTMMSGQSMAWLFDFGNSGPPKPYIAQSFQDGVISIAQQLEKNMVMAPLSSKLMIANFVSLHDLNETSSFGQLASANLMHELQIRNWNIMDPLFTRDLYIGPSGEFALSRDPKRLPGSLPSFEIIAGTYQTTTDSIILNVRLINAHSSSVISSAQVVFLKSQVINALVAQPPVMPILSLTK